MATAKRIKTGMKIRHRLFGGEICEGVVEGIEKCKPGNKYGKPVASAPIGAGNYVLSIDNGHWCYGDQVISIINK
jgi:hypothetical protein